MSSTETLAPIDPRAVFGRAHATSAGVLAGLRPEQMADPTPCDEFTVRDLAGHLLAVAQRVRNVGRGESPFSVGDTVVVDDGGWVDAWAEVGDEVQAAWSDDATLTRIVELPWATLPGAATLAMWTNELSVHTWDLATATGQQPEWDESVLEVAFAAIQQGLPAEGRIEQFEAVRAQMPTGQDDFSYPFKAAVDVGDDAPLIDRLVAWNGRDPGAVG
jgi:uncharacterized protein (TIGR03086 family)